MGHGEEWEIYNIKSINIERTLCRTGNKDERKYVISKLMNIKWNKMFTNVPRSQSGAVPKSSLSGVGRLGFWEIGKGGTNGWRVGQIGSVYKQPEKREDDSCHSWRRQVSGKGGTARGARGSLKGDKVTTPCTYVIVTYVQRIIERWIMLSRVHMIITSMNVVLYIIIIWMNVISNLNSV
jgi:hypothetical protein